MFTIQPVRSYAVPQLLEAAKNKVAQLDDGIDDNRAELVTLLEIFQDAVKRMTAKMESMPKQPISKAFFSDKRDEMQVYPTFEIKETCLYKKTYKECKEYIRNLKNSVEDYKFNKKKAKRLVASLEDDLALMAHMSNKASASSVIGAKSNVHEGEYLTIDDLTNWDYRDELISMSYNICLAVEFVTSYPLNHSKKPGFKETIQLIFYWVAPNGGSRGIWYHDKTGVGNTKDFVEVNCRDPFLQLYESKAAYLTSQFKYYVDVKHQQNYDKK